MAIEQVGSIFTSHPGGNHDNSGHVPNFFVPVPDLVVPVGTELVLMAASTHLNAVNGLEAATFTKNGVDAPMTPMGPAGDGNSAVWMGKLFWQILPDIGAGKRLGYDWYGNLSTSTGAHMFSVTFWKGINFDNPVRSGAGKQNFSGVYPITTPMLSAQAGDKIVAWFSGYANGLEGSVDTWDNATLLANNTHIGDADGAWATADPTGNQTVGVSAVTNFGFGSSLCAIVLIPGPGGLQYVPTSPAMVASAGDAQGIPIRAVAQDVTSDALTASTSDVDHELFVVAGRQAGFGWGVR
jgi:hypothetical protein